MTKYALLKHFPGYRVGDDGSVSSCRNFQGGLCDLWRTLRLKPQRSGHLAVCLRRDGQTLTRWVHRLVLEGFVGPCPEGMECRHLNGNPADNRLSNLRWDTLSENRKDRNRHGVWNLGAAHPMAKLSDAQVAALKRARAKGETQRTLAARFDVSQGYVSALLSGKHRQTP